MSEFSDTAIPAVQVNKLRPTSSEGIRMSTRSIIAKRQGNRVNYIYCHWDGYPACVGAKLVKYFNSDSLAEELVDFGDIRHFGNSISELTPIENGWHDDGAIYHVSAATKFPMSAIRYEAFVYLFDGGKWTVADVRKGKMDFQDLESYLEERGIFEPIDEMPKDEAKKLNVYMDEKTHRVSENQKITLTLGQLKKLVKEGNRYLDDFVPLDSVRDWIENGDEETFDLEDDSDEDYEYIDSVMAIRKKHRDAQVKGNVPKGFNAKRCPKCGGMGIYYIDSDAMGYEVWGHIECAKCGAHVSEELEGPDEDREKEELIGILVDRWNEGDID